MDADKKELRARLKQVRLSLSDAERTLKSHMIVARLKELIDWQAVKTLHYFEPIHDLLEADISGLVTYLEDTYPNIQLFTPRLIEGSWQMISIKDKAPPENMDIILVPMLGFDPKTLHRIGYGGGYYDKFLASQPTSRKIGVCFEEGKTDMLPNEPHDIALDQIVTESSVYGG